MAVPPTNGGIACNFESEALGLGLTMAFTAVAHAQDAQSWCKSKWGADDEKGAANHLTQELALEAAKLVKTGKVYQLGVEANSKTVAFPPRTFNITILQPGQTGGSTLGRPRRVTMTTLLPAGLGSDRSSMVLGTSASTTSTTTATRPPTSLPPMG